MAAIFNPIPKVKEHEKKQFPGQFPNENVICLVRRHWSIIFKYIFRLILAHLLPVVVFLILIYVFGWELDTESPMFIVIVLMVSAYYLGAWLLYIHEFVDYHLDIWVVTDQRVVSIEQEGLFKRTISELNLSKVQDVSAEIRGKVQTFLSYGNVFIQTASGNERFVFEEVPNPQEISRLIARTVETHSQKNASPKAV